MAQQEKGGDRTIKPTPTRLRKLRKDGVLPSANDFRAGFSLIVCLIVVFLAFRSTEDMIRRDLLAAIDAAVGPRALSPQQLGGAIAYDFALPALGIMLASGVAYFIASAIDMQGVSVHLKRLALDFNRLNPVEGVRNRFAMSAIVEFVRSLIKAALISALLALLAVYMTSDLFYAPTCGLACMGGVFLTALWRLVGIVAVMQIIASLLDLRLSRWLYMREHRMTPYELKREQREEYGNPELQRARKRQQAEYARVPVFRQLEQAQIVIVGAGQAIALAVSSTFEYAPIVVVRQTGQEAALLQGRAVKRGLAIAHDEAAAAALSHAPLAHEIPPGAYGPVARCLKTAGLI
jgi:type III secretion protein U